MIVSGAVPTRRKGGARARLALTLCGLLAWQGAEAAQYLIQPGDVVEITVTGLPELNARAPVDIDGKVSVPMLGRLQAAGLPLAELQGEMGRLLPTQTFRQRLPDGREVPVFISAQQLSLSFAQYRPIYVSGDVARPNELAFRLGMTVGDAVAAAGGYDTQRFRANEPFLDAADLRHEYQLSWIELARAEARAWRLRTELGEQASLRSGEFDRMPVPREQLAGIERLEVAQLQSRQDDQKKQEAFLAAAIGDSQRRIDLLSEQQAKEEDGAKADADDLRRLTGMLQQGVSTYLRFQDARRASLLSATQMLQTGNSLAQSQRQKRDLARELVRLADDRRMANLRDLQDTNVQMAELRSRLQATGDKILHVGILRSQLVRGAGGGARLRIVRGQGGARSELAAHEEDELLPGDRLEVALVVDGTERTASR